MDRGPHNSPSDLSANLEAIISSFFEPAFVVDTSKAVVAWNGAMERLTGISSDEAIARGRGAYREALTGADAPALVDLVGNDDPDTLARLRLVCRSVTRDGGRYVAEIRLPDGPEGAERDLLMCAAPICDREGRIVGALQTVSDITTRRQAERRVRLSEGVERAFRKRLEELNEVNIELSRAPSTDILARKAVELGTSRLGFDRLSFWLAEGEDWFTGTYGVDEEGGIRDEHGYAVPVRQDDLLVRIPDRTLPVIVTHDTDLRNHAREVVGHGDRAAAQLWDGERVVGFLCTDNLLSGKPVTLRDAELLRLYAVSLAHLHTRKLAEEELRRQRDFADSLIETAPVIVLVLDADCRIVRLNSFAERLLGYSLAEVKGRRWVSTFVLPRDRRRIGRAIQGSIAGVATDGSVSGVVRRDGSTRQIAWYDQAIREVHGNNAALLAIGLDVTEHARYEDEIRQSQKMDAVGRLAGGVAHDLNNQLTVIKGYSDLLLRRLAADSDIREQVLEIHKAAGQVEALTAQLLAFSRKQILQPRVLNLADVLEDMRNSLDRIAGEAVELKIVADESLWSVSVDPSQVRQALMNVTINSHDAMEHGGRIAIRMKNVVLGRSYSRRHKGAKPGPHVALSLRDTGTGMDEGTLSRALEPFFTTKQAGKGTGLGLPMVYGFVKQSGGHMTLASSPGKGTTVRIYLPAVNEKADRSAVALAEPAGTAGSAGTGRILLVEDEEPVRRLAVRFLSESGYDVLEAGDVPAALAVLAGDGGGVDLLVTDVTMPGRSGMDLADELRKTCPRLAVLFVSGYADGRSMKRPLLPGLEQLLGKPFRPEDLGSRVRSLLDMAGRG